MQSWVGLSYLIFRLLDTVEDAPWEATAEGAALKSRQFQTFLKHLRNNAISREIPQWIAAFPAEITEGEKLLIANSEMIFSDLHQLPTSVREAIFKAAQRMQTGMHLFSERSQKDSPSTLRLKHLTEVNQYCYFVAGIVGELLTQLLLIANPSFKPCTRMLENSIHFGLFLQKVNLLKDQKTDESQGRFLVPQRELLWESTIENAEHSFDYLLSIPHAEVGYRVFSAWSLFLGLYSLPFIRQAHHSGETHDLGKIPRELMWPLLQDIERVITDDFALRELFQEALAEIDTREQRELSGSSSQDVTDPELYSEITKAPIPKSSLSDLDLI